MCCLEKFSELKEWPDLLVLEGPKFEYFSEPVKSYLVVHPDFVDKAHEMFKDIKMNIVTGHRFLDVFVGMYAKFSTRTIRIS